MSEIHNFKKNKVINQKKRTRLIILTLSFFLLSISISITNFAASNSIIFGNNDYSITFLGVDSGNKWRYTVTCSESAPYAIGHWIIAWCGGSGSIISASHAYTYGADTSGTEIYGIKFDIKVEKGQTIEFWFVLDTNYLNNEVPVGIKAGKNIYAGTITGPIRWNHGLTLTTENTGNGSKGWEMVAIATTSNPDIIRVVFDWYGPFEENEVPGKNSNKLFSTYTDDLKEFESRVIMEDSFLNTTWYVEANFYILKNGKYYVKEFASEILENVHAPWFTSLPLAILVTLTIFLLTKKRKIKL